MKYTANTNRTATPCKAAFSACAFASVIAFVLGTAFAVSVFVSVSLSALNGILVLLGICLPVLAILFVRILVVSKFLPKRKRLPYCCRT